MHRRLPDWTPLVITGLALVAIPVLFAVPRQSERADTLLEAAPFVLAGAALVAAAFSARGWARTTGVVCAALLALAPAWFPVAFLAVDDFTRPDAFLELRVIAVAEDGQAFTLVLPAPVDEDGNLPPFLTDRPAWDDVLQEDEEGGHVLVLRGHAEYGVERAFRHDYGGDTSAWMRYEWSEGTEARLTSGGATVVFHAALEGRGGWCAGTRALTGAAGPDVSGFTRLTRSIACA